MNKHRVLQLILAALRDELTSLTNAANASFAAATDPDSKAENKYDTRSLEASYVARGQALRVAELSEAVQTFGAMSGKEVDADTPIGVGMLVSLSSTEGSHHYFIAPNAGGTEVICEGAEVFVITPASPLGQKLVGRKQGESLVLRHGVNAVIASVR